MIKEKPIRRTNAVVIECHHNQPPARPHRITIWLDIPSLRQCLSDFDVGKTRELIKDIGCTMVEMDDVVGFLGRSFCIFEIFSTIDGEAEFLPIVDLVRANYMKRLLAEQPVDVEAAKTRNGRSDSFSSNP